MQGVAEAVFFVLSLGMLFSHRFSANHPLRWIGGLIAIVSTVFFIGQLSGGFGHIFSGLYHPNQADQPTQPTIISSLSAAKDIIQPTESTVASDSPNLQAGTPDDPHRSESRNVVKMQADSLFDFYSGKLTKLYNGEAWSDSANLWLHRAQKQAEYMFPDVTTPPSDGPVEVLEPTNQTRWYPIRSTTLPTQDECRNAYSPDSTGSQSFTPEEITKNRVGFCFLRGDGQGGSVKINSIDNEGNVSLQYLTWTL